MRYSEKPHDPYKALADEFVIKGAAFLVGKYKHEVKEGDESVPLPRDIKPDEIPAWVAKTYRELEDKGCHNIRAVH